MLPHFSSRKKLLTIQHDHPKHEGGGINLAKISHRHPDTKPLRFYKFIMHISLC